MRPALLERANAAFDGDPPENGGVYRDDAGNVVGIVCLCKAPIAGLIPTSGTVARGAQVLGGVYVFGYYPNYQQAEMTFDDGSKHVSHGCQGCWQNLRDGTMERFYVRDLIGFQYLEDLGHDPTPESMWAQFLTRRPVGVRLVQA